MNNIENKFLPALRAAGVEIAPDAVCRVDMSNIEIGTAAKGDYAAKGHRFGFYSTLNVYAKGDSGLGVGREYNEINFGSSGAFAPDHTESYWRTIHAASILKNWDTVCEAVDAACKEYREVLAAVQL